jgi:hypothetical protein
VDPVTVGMLLPLTLLAVAGPVRAAREPRLPDYNADDRADFNDATRRLL